MPTYYSRALRPRRRAPAEENALKKAEPSPRDLLGAVNTASGGARNAWLAFLGLLAYLAVTLAGITHKDLLLISPTTLPFVNVKIPLTGFFTFAPLVLLFFHFGLLVQHVMLFKKIEALNARLRGAAPDHVWPDHPVQDEVHSYFFTQSFGGRKPPAILACGFHAMMMITFILAPVFILFYFQIKFLPFHDEFTTWLHRLYLLVDILIVVVAGFHLGQFAARRRPPRYLDSMPSVLFGWFLFPFLRWLGFTRTLVFLTLVISLSVATVPDGHAEKYVVAQTGWTEHAPLNCSAPDTSGRRAFTPSAWLFERKTLGLRPANAPWYCHAGIWLGLARNLDVADLDLVKDKQITKGETTINLRERDLRYADFSRSDLKQADFHGARLQGAKFVQSDLKAAKFRTAQAQGADLRDASLQGADLRAARLQGADLVSASLQGADLRAARLQGANLIGASLQGANLGGAHIWLTKPSNKMPEGLTGFAGLSVSPLAELGKQSLTQEVETLKNLARTMTKEKTPGQTRIAAAARRLENAVSKLLNPRVTNEWQEIHKKWREWADLKRRTHPAAEKLACYLGELACEDDTDKAYLAQSLISYRIIGPGTGGRIAQAVFHARFRNCPAAKKIPASLMARLKKAADEDAAKRADPAAQAASPASAKPKQCSWK